MPETLLFLFLLSMETNVNTSINIQKQQELLNLVWFFELLIEIDRSKKKINDEF